MRLLSLIVTASTIFCFSAQAYAGTLTLRFTGIKEIQGAIPFGIFTSTDKYPTGKSTYDGRMAVTGSEVIVHVENIPYGTYAIAASQDVNNNGVMDYKMGFIPLEPIGFSNGAKAGMFGPPSFKKAMINFTNDSQVFDINLYYAF